MGFLAYRRSKLAQNMLTRDLAEAHPELAINSLHPGTLIDTAMVREAGIAPRGPSSRGVDAITCHSYANHSVRQNQRRLLRLNRACAPRSAGERRRHSRRHLFAAFRTLELIS